MKNIKMVERYSTRLKEALSDNRMKATELAELTSIPKPAISQYMNDINVPKQKRNHIIALALSVNPVWLYGYDVKKHLNDDAELISSEIARNYLYGKLCNTAIGLNDDCLEILLNVAAACKERKNQNEKRGKRKFNKTLSKRVFKKLGVLNL
jgi:transcriptional regulator with XRE-family HTH domain